MSDLDFFRGRIPGPIDTLADPIYRWARNEIRRGVQRGIYMAGEAAYDAAMREVRALHDDVEAILRYIAGLPEGLRQYIAYEAFAAGFSHYIPKKLLRQYVWGNGADLTLTKQEMIDCNPYINLLTSKAFRDQLAAAASKPGVAVPFELPILSGALTNGSLGQFTARTKGTLVVTSATDWKAEGEMSFYDVWDFDPKDFKTGGRSAQGEIKTRVANSLLPGKGFKINSEVTPFSQSQNDSTVVWAGGTPHAEPDRIAAMDVALTQADK